MRHLAIVSLLAFALVGCRDKRPVPAGEPVSHDDAEEILESTPWLDKIPQHERDVIRAYVFDDGQGLYFIGNSYKATFEALTYSVERDGLTLRFLDENKKYKTDWKIERFRGEVFDYKLTLKKDPRGPKVYYGFDHGRELPETVSKIKALAGEP
jgi:hypothetical protein